MARKLLEVQMANDFHQDVESQSTISLSGASLNHTHAPAQLTEREAFSGIIYASHAMGELIARVARVCDSKAPMLITGETGTGKELLARAAHDASGRRERQFIPFNCGDLTPELIGSELFGYRRGSFTNADRDYKGVIRQANGGTLFLDEIGELPFVAQPKLLRFLQESEVRSLGEPKPIKVDVHVIAATNRDLETEVRSGRFRVDLYHRLNALPFHIPPLRERREDIRPLTEHFLARLQRETGKQGLRLSDEAWALIFDYQWPGNVRQVENWSRRLVAFAESNELTGLESALDALRDGPCAPPPAAVLVGGENLIDIDLPLHEAEARLQRLLIEHALKVTGGNRIQAAAKLKIHRDGLRKMIDRLGIKVHGDDTHK
jgi:transcriptional regulator with GAF, ATPase, and Fis domain